LVIGWPDSVTRKLDDLNAAALAAFAVGGADESLLVPWGS
jgi:hypothetical protein